MGSSSAAVRWLHPPRNRGRLPTGGDPSCSTACLEPAHAIRHVGIADGVRVEALRAVAGGYSPRSACPSMRRRHAVAARRPLSEAGSAARISSSTAARLAPSTRFSVIAIVGDKLRTACHQPDGTNIVSPSRSTHCCGRSSGGSEPSTRPKNARGELAATPAGKPATPGGYRAHRLRPERRAFQALVFHGSMCHADPEPPAETSAQREWTWNEACCAAASVTSARRGKHCCVRSSDGWTSGTGE